MSEWLRVDDWLVDLEQYYLIRQVTDQEGKFVIHAYSKGNDFGRLCFVTPAPRREMTCSMRSSKS